MHNIVDQLLGKSPGFSALAPAVHFEVYRAKPVSDQAQLCRHARQCRVDVCIVVGLQSLEGDLPTVKRISGHKTLAMVERYSHQNGTHIQAAMDKLQARFKLAS